MGRLVLGLDIGITSIGYGVIDIDNDEFVDYGVRLFKEGTASNNEERRIKRGARRLKRRKINRLLDMKKYLTEIGLMDDSYIPLDNPYFIRKKGLNEILSKNELVTAILHITKNRGTCLEGNADETQDEQSTKHVLSENDKALKNRYICEIQLDRLENDGKIRGINNNFKTEDYIKELTAILNNQALEESCIDKIVDIVSRRRRYDQGPGSEKSPTPYGSYRIQDGQLVHVNLIDVMRGKCSVFPDQLRAPQQSYSAELFNLLNDLNNLKIKGEKMTYDEKLKVIDFVNEKGGITIKQLLKLLDTELADVTGFRIDKNEKPLLTELKGYKKVFKVFKEYQVSHLIQDKTMVDLIMDINTKMKGVKERAEHLAKLFPGENKDLIAALASLKGISGYHSLSFKALRLLNNEMLKTEMNQMQVLHQLDMFDKYRATTKGQKKIYPDDTAILSPVAKRAHRETFKVINKLRSIYGEFDSIVIETTRDKNSQEQRKRINESQKNYDNRNKEIDILLKEAGYDCNRINAKTKMKIRLYLDQDCKSAYTLQTIDLRELIQDQNKYEIDHIIPISISLDDSYANKVLATHEENQLKGNLTPIQAYLKGKFTKCDLNTYKTSIRNNKKLGRKKREYLLSEADITKFETVQGFISRNLVDTSYACRTVMNTLNHYFKDNEINTKVHTIRGQATSAFRKRIGLQKDREEDYFHHAIDALIVASLKKMNLINSYLIKMNFNQMYDEATGEVFAVLPDNSYLDEKYISFVSTLKNIYEESNKWMIGAMPKENMHYPLIKVSHKVDTKPNRKISDDTIYSTRNVNNQEMLVERIKNIYDPKEKAAIALTNDIINNNCDKYIMYHKDPQTFEKIKEIILNHFEIYKSSKDNYIINKKGLYELKGINPLSLYYEEYGPVTKYAKKNNGPKIHSMKFYSEKIGNHLSITHKYHTNDKKVITKQISPYRTDFYQSPEGKYKFVTVRYKDIAYNSSKDKYIIDNEWYENQKQLKNIDKDWKFVCSMHRDELIGIIKKSGDKYIFDQSIEKDGKTLYHDGKHYEILKFTATNNDMKGIIEVKPIHTRCKKQLMPTVGKFVKIQKFSTDVLGNLYINRDNVLKLEF